MKIKTLLTMTTLVLALNANAHAGDADAGKTKAQVCASCHGADGNSASGAFPRLAGQYADYLAKALADYKTGERNNPIMKGFAANLTAADMEDLAAYFSKQKGLEVNPARGAR